MSAWLHAEIPSVALAQSSVLTITLAQAGDLSDQQTCSISALLNQADDLWLAAYTLFGMPRTGIRAALVAAVLLHMPGRTGNYVHENARLAQGQHACQHVPKAQIPASAGTSIWPVVKGSRW